MFLQIIFVIVRIFWIHYTSQQESITIVHKQRNRYKGRNRVHLEYTVLEIKFFLAHKVARHRIARTQNERRVEMNANKATAFELLDFLHPLINLATIQSPLFIYYF